MKIHINQILIETVHTSLQDYLNRSFGTKFLYAPDLRPSLFWAKNAQQHHADLLTEFFDLPDTDESVDTIAKMALDQNWQAWGGFWNSKTGELAIYNSPEFGKSPSHGTIPSRIVKAITRLISEPSQITIIEQKEFQDKIREILTE